MSFSLDPASLGPEQELILVSFTGPLWQPLSPEASHLLYAGKVSTLLTQEPCEHPSGHRLFRKGKATLQRDQNPGMIQSGGGVPGGRSSQIESGFLRCA